MDPLRQYLENLQDDEYKDIDQVRAEAADLIVNNQNTNENYYNSKRKEPRKYRVGDYVVIRNVDVTPGHNKKLLPKFKGPYVVKEVLDFDRYVITDVDGFQMTQLPYNGIVGPDSMKPWSNE